MTIGEYRIVRQLGSGGMGRVYEAVHDGLCLSRAVKVFSNDSEHTEALRRRFLSEGRMLANLVHPRVVRVYDLSVDDATGSPYFAMDLVLSSDGTPRTLEDERRRGVDEKQIAAWFCDICEGLDYIHSQGVVHRDVKLENMLVGQDGRVVISDFGVSRVFSDDLRQKISATDTIPNELGELCMGSSHYLAPELRSGAYSAMPEADAWALGVLLFRMLTGFWFEDDNRDKCLALLDGFDMPWRPVISRLCDRDASRRLSNGLLQPYADSVCGQKPVRGRCRILAAAALVMAAAAVFCGYLATRRHSSADTLLSMESPPEHSFFNAWQEQSKAALMERFGRMDDEVERVLLDFMERRMSYFSYDRWWPEEMVRRMDEVVSAEMNCTDVAKANSAQLMVLAGEVYRQKRRHSLWGGEFPEDIDRIAALAKNFVQDASGMRFDPAWAFEIMESALPFSRMEGRRIGGDDSHFQGLADTWLMKMIRAATLASEAMRLEASQSSSGNDTSNEVSDRRALARLLFSEAYALKPDRYRAAERMISASGSPDAARRWFETCQRCCFDDLRAWTDYALMLARERDGRERVERILDKALDTGRYDTWVPAFYVIGRWTVLARCCAGDAPADADGRGWAYEDGAVREKTLDVIQRYVDGDLMNRAPEMRRNVILAIFAAVSLTCRDETLAEKLVLRLPEKDFRSVQSEAAHIGTTVFRRLFELRRNATETESKKY